MRSHLAVQLDKNRLRWVGADKAAPADVVGRCHCGRQLIGQDNDSSEEAEKGRRCTQYTCCSFRVCHIS